MDWNTTDVARVYSELAGEWDFKSRLIRSKWGTTNRLRRLVQEMDVRGKKLLDFGSGTGKVYGDLLSRGGESLERVTMVDVSDEMCRLAKDKISDSISANVVSGDEYSPEISEFSPYDVITMMQVLHHLPMPRRTLIELRRYASKDAVLIGLTPGPLYQSNIFPYKPDDSIDLVGRRTSESWERIIESSGWQIETIYDDRFMIEFLRRRDYFSFIRSVGIVNKMSGYRILEEAAERSLEDDEEGPLCVLGQYLTFLCKLGKEGGCVE